MTRDLVIVEILRIKSVSWLHVITFIECCVTLCTENPLAITHHRVKFNGHKHCGSRDITFSISSDLVTPCNQGIFWFYGKELLDVCNHPVTFYSHTHFSNRYPIILFCLAMSLDVLIVWSCGFMGRNRSK